MGNQEVKAELSAMALVVELAVRTPEPRREDP